MCVASGVKPSESHTFEKQRTAKAEVNAEAEAEAVAQSQTSGTSSCLSFQCSRVRVKN